MSADADADPIVEANRDRVTLDRSQVWLDIAEAAAVGDGGPQPRI